MKTLTQQEYDSLVALARFGDSVLRRSITDKEGIYRNSIVFYAIACNLVLFKDNDLCLADLAKATEGL